MRRFWVAIPFLISPLASGQQACVDGIRVEGTVMDPSGATIAGAEIRASDGVRATADESGHFVLPCVAAGLSIHVQAQGFDSASLVANAPMGETAHLTFQLSIANVETVVQVSASSLALDDTDDAGTVTLNARQIDQLPDDPDDLLSQLQQMAASAGGDPTNTILTINGFQNGSALPPKSSIASIRINPDMFSSEYQSPLWRGARIEITTKAGADTFHGAVFATLSNAALNARDPLSTASTPADKQRYGFEFSGPIVANRAGFALALERRAIKEFNVVNAITLDANFNQTPLHEAVQAPQRLWIGSARGDWQVTAKDTASLAFAANVNRLGNQGVGGLVLADGGFTSLASEYDLRFNNTQTIDANSLHETRIGYTWKRTQQTPNSTAPSLQVAGFFTSGGSMAQALNDRERALEIDEDFLLTRGKHSLKIGAQSLALFEHNFTPTNFNGAFVFGGGSAPSLDANGNPTGQTTTITAAEQYRRAQLSLAGGNPTSYQMTSGEPLVAFTQWHLGLYAQDTIKFTPHFSMDAGLRYQLQTTPASFASVQPRLGISWTLGAKQSWIFHLRGGLFTGPTSTNIITDVTRLDGVRQHETTVYSPSFSNPLTPVAGSIQLGTQFSLFPHFRQDPYYQGSAVVEHDFPHHWHAQADYNLGGDWNDIRVININAPQVASSIGTAPDPTAALLAPRPITPGLNIFQYQDYGHTRGWWFATSISQQSLKWLNVKVTYWYVDFRGNSGTPQSTYSSQGESARPDWMRRDGLDLNGTLNLPSKIAFSTYFNTQPGTPFNITTGTDANGDGTFNDRPSFTTTPGAGVYSTRYGLLTTNTVNGDVPYNLGRMSWVVHFGMNLSRSFQLNPGNKESPRLLTLNARAANVLNKTRVTSVGTIVSSPNFGQALAAEEARRIEFGARLSF